MGSEFEKGEREREREREGRGSWFGAKAGEQQGAHLKL
jgi:hypothetical protein